MLRVPPPSPSDEVGWEDEGGEAFLALLLRRDAAARRPRSSLSRWKRMEKRGGGVADAEDGMDGRLAPTRVNTHTRGKARSGEREGRGGGVDLRWRVCLLSRAKGGKGATTSAASPFKDGGSERKEGGGTLGGGAEGGGRRSLTLSRSHTLSLSSPSFVLISHSKKVEPSGRDREREKGGEVERAAAAAAHSRRRLIMGKREEEEDEGEKKG